MKVLGISALYHDSAAALVSENEIIAAAQEERFTRKKHDPRIPISAINFCLAEGHVHVSELDAVVYYDNPILTADRILKNCIALGEKGDSFLKNGYNSLLGNKLWIHKHLKKKLGILGKNDKLLCVEHHIAHASSAFYPSPFERAAVLTIDGVGEWATTTIGYGEGNKVELIKEIDYPHSLGLLYSAFTYFCGFKVNSGEYKLMGLAPYGVPIYYNQIKENLIDIKPDGSYRLNLEYFSFICDELMVNEKFAKLFQGPSRQPESQITKREMDMAASVQKVTEEVILLLAKHTKDITGMENLALAGGVALNCVANGKLLKAGLFENIWIQPAAGDAGGSLGAALYTVYHYLKGSRQVTGNGRDAQKGSYLGPAFSDTAIQKYLDKNKYVYTKYDDMEQFYNVVAKELANGKIVGFFTGKMEFGPRALGARSIIADPRSAEMQSKMNIKIKFRESFRPFAPAILAEDVNKYFDIDVESPYMLLVAPVKEDLQLPFDLKSSFDDNGDNMLPIVNVPRSRIPAVTHVDYSARIQTVSEKDNPKFYNLIKAFKKITGCSVLVNTSFNVRGEPIVCSPDDAYTCFMRTDMDILILENFMLYKEKQPKFEDSKNWREEYELD